MIPIIPYEQWELENMLDDFKKEFNLTEYKVCELGGNLVLPEYIVRGITTKLQTMEMEFVKETTLSNGFLRKLYMKKIK